MMRDFLNVNWSWVEFARVITLQERLEPRVRREILAELRTPDRLRDSLDVVDIILGFLSTGGGKAEKSLGDYVDKVLKMKRRSFSPKVKQQSKHTNTSIILYLILGSRMLSSKACSLLVGNSFG